MIKNYTMTLGSNLIGSALVNTASSAIAGLLFSGAVKYMLVLMVMLKLLNQVLPLQL